MRRQLMLIKLSAILILQYNPNPNTNLKSTPTNPNRCSRILAYRHFRFILFQNGVLRMRIAYITFWNYILADTKPGNLRAVLSTCIYTRAGRAFDNHVTMTFNLLTSGSVNAEHLPCTPHLPNLVSTTQAVFLLERGHADR